MCIYASTLILVLPVTLTTFMFLSIARVLTSELRRADGPHHSYDSSATAVTRVTYKEPLSCARVPTYFRRQIPSNTLQRSFFMTRIITILLFLILSRGLLVNCCFFCILADWGTKRIERTWSLVVHNSLLLMCGSSESISKVHTPYNSTRRFIWHVDICSGGKKYCEMIEVKSCTYTRHIKCHVV